MNVRQIAAIRQAAIELYKTKDYAGYSPELQPVLCTIIAFVDAYERETGQKLSFTPEIRPVPQSVDDL
jgi:hypothetical protein